MEALDAPYPPSDHRPDQVRVPLRNKERTMSSIEGKVVVITGASSGLGEATARLLATSGAKVFLGARRSERLNGVVSDIRRAGGQAASRTVVVTDRAEIVALIQA